MSVRENAAWTLMITHEREAATCVIVVLITSDYYNHSSTVKVKKLDPISSQ